MTWTPEGAAAMLALRCIHLSQQWDKFVDFRVQREMQKLYPNREQTLARSFHLAT